MLGLRRSKNERKYEVKNLGSVIVERVQMPQSLHQLDGSVYESMEYTYRIRVDGGPILFERVYAVGEQESLDKIRGNVREFTDVKSTSEAEWLFWEDVAKLMGYR